MSARDARSLLRAAFLCVCALAASAQRAAHAQDAGAPRATRVLFLMPDLDAGVRAQLQDALYAQLALVDAELVLRDDQLERDPAVLARAERADAVLWLALAADGRWQLNILDVGQERAVVRRIDPRSGQQAAAIEAVAVLAREASRGGPLPPQPATDDPTPEPDPAEPAGTEPTATTEPELASPEPEATEAQASLPPPTVRLALFYEGVDFAKETSFSHSINLSARLDWQVGLFGGLRVGWAGLAEPPGNLAVQRIPLGGALGYRIRLVDALWADLELGMVLDLLQRTTRGALGQADSLRVSAALAPRLRGEYRPLDFLGFFAGFGLDVAFSTLRYETAGTPRETLLTPSWVRPALEAGVALYP